MNNHNVSKGNLFNETKYGCHPCKYECISGQPAISSTVFKKKDGCHHRKHDRAQIKMEFTLILPATPLRTCQRQIKIPLAPDPNTVVSCIWQISQKAIVFLTYVFGFSSFIKVNFLVCTLKSKLQATDKLYVLFTWTMMHCCILSTTHKEVIQ